MKPNDNEYSFVRLTDGTLTFDKGFLIPWQPQVSDPLAPAVWDAARDLETIAQIESIPLRYKLTMKRTGTNAERQDIEHFIRVVTHLNERIGYVKYSFSRTKTSFSIRRIR